LDPVFSERMNSLVNLERVIAGQVCRAKGGGDAVSVLSREKAQQVLNVPEIASFSALSFKISSGIWFTRLGGTALPPLEALGRLDAPTNRLLDLRAGATGVLMGSMLGSTILIGS
jgi:hypothetical protein